MTELEPKEYSGKKVVVVLLAVCLLIGVGGVLSRVLELPEKLGIVEAVPKHVPRKGVVPVEDVDAGEDSGATPDGALR